MQGEGASALVRPRALTYAGDMETGDTPKPLRLIVAGGRDFTDYAVLCRVLQDWLARYADGPVTIISGHARGADTLGERFARERGHGLEIYPADWESFGKRAGFIRNSRMVAIADAAVAFWDGASHGTLDTIRKMRADNKPISVFDYGGREMPPDTLLD